MNRRLQHYTGHPHSRLTGFASLLAGSALAILTCGCATSRNAPLIVQQATDASATNGPPAQNLRLVTYNIWGLPRWMTGAPAGRYPKIARELKRLDPDFILLQEAWTAKARKSVPAGGQWFVARAARQHTFFQQCGLVTLSKFPIIGGEFYPFTRAAFPDRFVHKGTLKVTVQLPDGEVLNIWNVHLQDGGTQDLRRSQMRELIAHVNAANDGQVADVVSGDFNTTPDDALFGELQEAFGSSVRPRDGTAGFVTWDGMLPASPVRKTLDYVFIVPHDRTIQADTCVAFAAPDVKERLSDHFGIEADLNLAPLPVPANVADSPPNETPEPSVVASRVLPGGGL